ncbi:MAG: LLM class flavin-dependent oxidoreductase [Acidimicrobiales bacterium]
MDIALEAWGADYPRVEEACRFAEASGLDGFTYGESPHGLNLECWSVLAALARVTHRIRLGPVIANVLPEYRSPLLLARQAEAVSAIAPGRVELRTGVGAAAGHARPWWNPHGIGYPSYDRRLADLEEALATWDRRWDGAGVDIPITVAATGERAMALAARHARSWETSFCTPTEYVRRRTRFASIAARVAPGRTVTGSLEVDAFVATTRAGVDAVLAAAGAERGRGEDLGPVFDRALVGTPDRIAADLAALARAGVDRVLVAPHDPLDLDAIAALADAGRLVRGGPAGTTGPAG